MEFTKTNNGFVKYDENGRVIAEITYSNTSNPNVVVADHTFVDSSLRGQGVAGKLLGLGPALSRAGVLFLYSANRLAQRVFIRRLAPVLCAVGVEIRSRIRALPAFPWQNQRSAPFGIRAGNPIGHHAADRSRCRTGRPARTHPLRSALATSVCTAHADVVAGLVRHRLFLLRHFYLAAETLGRTRQYGGQNL